MAVNSKLQIKKIQDDRDLKVIEQGMAVSDFPAFTLKVTEIWKTFRESKVSCKHGSVGIQIYSYRNLTSKRGKDLTTIYRQVKFPALI